MGRQTRIKNEKEEAFENQFKNVFGHHSKNKKLALASQTEKPLLDDIDSELLQNAVNSVDTFKCNLKTSNRTKKVTLLAKHLFSKYKAPKILEQVWDSKYKTMQRSGTINKSFLEYKKWFVCVGTGGSIHKEFFKGFLTKKEGHTFLMCPYTDLSVEQALVYSIAVCENSNVGNALRIAKSKLNEKNIKDEFWKNVIKFFAQEGKTPESINAINDLVDFIVAEKAANRHFSVFGNGLTLDSLKKRMIDWHYALRRMKAMGNIEWEGHDIDDFLLMRNEDKLNEEKWTINQIKSAKLLMEEGNAQHHCVASYKNNCINGNISIWSLKMNGKRKVTIELRNNGSIAQVRGYANRMATGEENSIIIEWCKVNNFYGYRG